MLVIGKVLTILLVLSVLVPVGADAQRGQIENPLEGGVTTISGLLVRVAQWLLGLVAILALLALIIGGTRMILAFGREDAVASAKKIMFWAVIGLIVAIASLAIVNIVVRDIFLIGPIEAPRP
jgi:uncharacterized membrane protein